MRYQYDRKAKIVSAEIDPAIPNHVGPRFFQQQLCQEVQRLRPLQAPQYVALLQRMAVAIARVVDVTGISVRFRRSETHVCNEAENVFVRSGAGLEVAAPGVVDFRRYPDFWIFRHAGHGGSRRRHFEPQPRLAAPGEWLGRLRSDGVGRTAEPSHRVSRAGGHSFLDGVRRLYAVRHRRHPGHLLARRKTSHRSVLRILRPIFLAIFPAADLLRDCAASHRSHRRRCRRALR